MGMDILGRTGTEFRSGCWREIWEYTARVCEGILTAEDRSLGHYNEGHVISREKARAITAKLAAEIKSGRTSKFEMEHQAEEFWHDFTVEHVMLFADFCLTSVGFVIR